MASRMEPGQADPSTELVDGVVMSGPLRNFDVSTVTMVNGRPLIEVKSIRLTEAQGLPQYSAEAFPRFQTPPH
jgi:hypothetical protein